MGKEKEVSNNLLAFLVGIAIVVSLVGILSVQQPSITVYNPLTGYAATNVNGTVSATISRTASILIAGTIAFGSGIVYQNNSAQAIVLNSTGNCASVNTSFSGASCTAQDDSDNKFTIENDGNINITVKVDINTSLSALGLGASGDFGFLLGNEKATASRPACINETGARDTGLAGDNVNYSRQFPNVTGFRDPAGGGKFVSIYSVPGGSNPGDRQLVVLCSKLQADDLFDKINMTIYLNISRTIQTGTKNYLLNFTAVDSFTTEG